MFLNYRTRPAAPTLDIAISRLKALDNLCEAFRRLIADSPDRLAQVVVQALQSGKVERQVLKKSIVRGGVHDAVAGRLQAQGPSPSEPEAIRKIATSQSSVCSSS